jgi:hypothetical protein
MPSRSRSSWTSTPKRSACVRWCGLVGRRVEVDARLVTPVGRAACQCCSDGRRRQCRPAQERRVCVVGDAEQLDGRWPFLRRRRRRVP